MYNCIIYDCKYLYYQCVYFCYNLSFLYYNSSWLQGVKGELQSLEILSDIVRKELKKRSKWLLIIDGLSGSNQDMSIGSMGGTLSVEAGDRGSMIPALAPPIQQDPILTGSDMYMYMYIYIYLCI